MTEDDFHKKKTLPGWMQEQKLEVGFNISPKMIGPYKIEGLMERGGMSYLFLGVHPETRQMLAIKVLSPTFVTNPEMIAQFLKETKIIGMTNHPNIVKLYGHGEWEGGLYIAMEYIQGSSLRQVLLRNPISLKRALEIVIDIAYALCHLHTHGVIHRDLKPENILITESGQVKVIDFGIAQLLTERKTPDSPPRQRLIGTPIYMSPEQREDPEAVSYPSDLYSLGIIAYELVLGKLSHGHIHLTLMPKGIQKILNKALQHAASERYQDVVDFITDVSAYLHSTHLQKEKHVGDQLSELSENFRHVQERLSSQKPADWNEIEMGVAMHQGVDLIISYYDFFNVESKKYGILFAESSAKDAEGIVHLSMLKGMVQSLKQTVKSPSEMAAALNRLIPIDQMEDVITFNQLLIFSQEPHVNYICCGRGNLWHIPANGNSPSRIESHNIALGIDVDHLFSETSFEWGIGDYLMFFSNIPSNSEKNYEAEFLETLHLKEFHQNKNVHPQHLLEMILTKIKLSSTRQIFSKTFTFICIKKIK